MKKFFSALLVFMLFLSAAAPSSLASVKSSSHKATYYVKEKSVKIYKSSKTSSKVVVTVKKGTKINSTKKAKIKKTTWLYVTVGKKKGWVAASKVTTKKPVKKKTDLDKLNQVAKKHGVKVKYKKDEGTKVYNLYFKGYEEGWIEVRSKTVTEGFTTYYEGKHLQIFKPLTAMGIDSAIALGFPVSKKELTALAKKAQSHPHKTYFLKNRKVTITADRGKTLYLNYYEGELPDYDY